MQRIFQATFWALTALSLGVFGCTRHSEKPLPARNKPVSALPEKIDETVPHPKAVASRTVHNFGTQAPFQILEHTFEIRNEGEAPLTLEQGDSTCKCTLSQISHSSILPGETAAVKLEWNTGDTPGSYSHAAKIYTNDPHPSRRTLKFGVQGVVQSALASDSDGVSFGKLFPDITQTEKFILYSQAWTEFAIDEVDVSLSGLTWRYEPAQASELVSLKAQSGYAFYVTSPEGVSEGVVSGYFRVKASPRAADSGSSPNNRAPADVSQSETASPPEAPTPRSDKNALSNESTRQPHVLELPVYGAVRSPLAVLGESIDSTGTVHLGSHFEGDERAAKLRLKVRDAQRTLVLKHIDVSPAFVQVNVTPLDANVAEHGLYDVTIRIPPDAPPGSYTGEEQGKLVIETDHIKKPTLKLNLDFVIVRPVERGA